MEPTISLDRVIKRAWAIFRERTWRFVGTTALLIAAIAAFVVIYAIPTGILSGAARTAFAVILGIVLVAAIFIAYLLYLGSITRLVEAAEWGREPGSVTDVLQSLKGRLGAMAGVTILAMLAIGAGLIFFVVPGVVLAIIWAVFLPVIVVEGLGVDSLSRSRELVRGNGLGVFGLHLVWAVLLYLVIGLVFLIGFVLGAILGAIGAGALAVVIIWLVQIAVELVVVPLSVILITVLYFELARIDYGRRGTPAAAQ